MSNKDDNKEHDNLEDFFFQNKDSFESFEPSPELWLKINNKTNKQSEGKRTLSFLLNPWLKFAAIFVAGIFAGWLFFNNNGAKEAGSLAIKKDTGVTIQYNVSLDDVSKKLGEVEQYYQARIDQRIKELEVLRVDQSMYEEVSFLDTEYKSLQHEVKDNLDKERIIDAMVQNLRFRLVILESILKEVETKKEIRGVESGRSKEDISL